MCGIVGILARGSEVSEELLERATQSLAHRGPDDHGTVILRESVPERIELGLGNRRLAILDLSPLGHQPMRDESTGNWLVHNGEIYNFREIRSRLESEGSQFDSQSDTEVILKAYARWGENCVAQFRGMFAFAVWDAQQHRLFIARDPMGIKPLYYYQSDRHFLFASELRTLLKTGLIRRNLSQTALLNYLAFGSVYEPDTLIEGVHALPPGHSLTWERGTVTTRQYWDLTFDASGTRGNLAADHAGLENRVHALLEESVRMQLVSDVPVGVFLSGGIDSSSLVGILSHSGIRPSTFSIVFREADYSEAEHSRAVASLFKTDHHEMTVSQQDALATIPDALRAMDQPTIDGINTYFVSQQTRAAGIKVALSGLGGDEVFAGYGTSCCSPHGALRALWAKLPRPVRKVLLRGFRAARSQQRSESKTVRIDPGKRKGFTSIFSVPHVVCAQRAGGAGAFARRRSGPQGGAPLRETCSERRNLDPINRVSYLESRCYMLNTLLRDSDFMSMAHGLEVRVPLLDHQLAQQVMAFPVAGK